MIVVLDGLLDGETLRSLREKLSDAEWESGARTAGAFARDQKNNSQLADGAPLTLELGERIVDRIWTNPLFISAALPRKLYPPRFNRYGVGQTYGAHVDAALMRSAGSDRMVRTDLSITVFLSDPEDYDGGELEIESSLGAQAVKLAAGDAVLYPASTLHRVAPVTRGERLASFFWVESLVADDAERAMLFDLDQSIQRLSGQLGADNSELAGLSGLYHNLLRRWAKT
ncbi:MAG: Fe2+-dependent dioxygenase [Porphyrobacter sp.]|nr:Fe2+-dependent dioxygenase [Porphyrobacter sp.]